MREGTKPFINEEYIEEPLAPVNKVQTYYFSYEFGVDASDLTEANKKAGEYLALKDWTEISKDPAKHLIWLDTFDPEEDDFLS